MIKRQMGQLLKKITYLLARPNLEVDLSSFYEEKLKLIINYLIGKCSYFQSSFYEES